MRPRVHKFMLLILIAAALPLTHALAQVAGSPIFWSQQPQLYTITYNGNGATGGTVPINNNSYQQSQVGSVATLGTLAKSGYVFLGWNTASNGTGLTYVPGGSLEMGNISLTLYAQWSASGSFPSNADTLTGDNGDNILVGGLGADVLSGGSGNDTIYPDLQTGENYQTFLRSNASLAFWLDAADPSANGTTPANGATVATWYDKSSSGFNIGAVSAATWQASGIGGKPTLRFNGSGNYYELAYKASLNGTTVDAMVVAQTRGGDGSFRSPLTSRSTENTTNGYLFYATPANIWTAWTGSGGVWPLVDSTVASSTASFMVISINDTSWKSFLNGALIGTKTGYLKNTTRPLRVGGGATEGTVQYLFNGDISEVMIFSSNLSNTNREVLSQVMSKKYALSCASATDSALAADSLTGGPGADTFVWNQFSFSDPSNRDIVVDFSITDGDKLDFSAMPRTFTVRGTAGLQASGVAQIAWISSSGNTIVQLDFNGDTTPEMEIQLNGVVHTNLTSASLVLP